MSEPLYCPHCGDENCTCTFLHDPDDVGAYCEICGITWQGCNGPPGPSCSDLLRVRGVEQCGPLGMVNKDV